MPPKKPTEPTPKPKAPRRPRAKTAATTATTASAATTDPTSTAVLAFLADWRQLQQGDITAGESFVVRYEPTRYPEAREIVGFAKFLPGGQVRHATLIAGKRPTRKTAPPAPLAAEIPVPPETRHVELWFQCTDETGAIVWDSRFGENYRFEVVHPQPAAADSLHVRAGAVVDGATIAVEEDAAVKENVLGGRPGYPSPGASLQTSLHIVTRVRQSAALGNVWIDAHFFEADATLIHGDTLPLRKAGLTDDGRALYVLDGVLYQGSVATPGSASPRPDVRTVQYRLYCEVGDLLVTDGVLHRCELATDALST